MSTKLVIKTNRAEACLVILSVLLFLGSWARCYMQRGTKVRKSCRLSMGSTPPAAEDVAQAT